MTRRLMFGASYLLLAVIVGLAVPFGITLGRRLTNELGARVEREAFTSAAAIEDHLEGGKHSQLQPVIGDIATQVGGRVLVVDPQGVLLADSFDEPGQDPPSYASRPEIADALSGNANWNVRYSETLQRDLLVSAVPVRSGNRILGVVRVSYPMDDVNRNVTRSYWLLALVGLTALVVGLVLSGGLARWVVRPLRSAAAAARRIAAGDLETRVPVEGPPEVQELARDLNTMTDELSDLLRANRNFAADASHQLRTPLTALRLSLESAEHGGDPATEIPAALEQARRLEETVDALLALAAKPQSPERPVDLAPIAREAVRSVPHPDLQIAIDGDGSAIADPQRVREVLTSLLDNARRYATARVQVSIRIHNDRAFVRIDDDGPGILEDEWIRVFDRFYRGRRAHGRGTGLGLSVARELARADGGQITLVKGELGGACFEVVYTASSEGDTKLRPTPRTVRI